MMGQIDEWLFRSVAGIRQKAGTHGMRHIVIDPLKVEGISHVKASIQTIYGEVRVEYNKDSGNLNVSAPPCCDVEIPQRNLP